jgi:hypothetical protein
MPAIQPARLKIQAAELALGFGDPEAFCRALDILLEYYADRTYRPGLIGEPPPLLPAYNVPTQVLRVLERELAAEARRQPTAALQVCDALWERQTFEFCWLAAAILGQVTPDPPAEILARIERWASPSTEERLLEAIITSGMARLRQERRQVYFDKVTDWLETGRPFLQHLGLRALLPLMDASATANLPALFQRIAPLVRAAPAYLRPDLLEVLRRLAKLSPKETAFFLRQNLAIQQDNPGTAWLARHSLEQFPVEVQVGLRAALREAR